MDKYLHGRRPKILSGLLLAVLFVYWLTCGYSARSALPWTATDIHEYDSGYSGMTMDYFIVLKAKISQLEFEEYVKRMKLSPMEGDHISQFGWDVLEARWWNPTRSMSGAFRDLSARGSLQVLAKYENGYLYFFESCGY